MLVYVANMCSSEVEKQDKVLKPYFLSPYLSSNF